MVRRARRGEAASAAVPETCEHLAADAEYQKAAAAYLAVPAADLDLFGRGSLFELLCTARTRAGDLGPALHLAEEALAAYRLLDDEPGVGRSLETLGRVLWIQGDYGLARARLQESRAVARRRS